MQSINCKNDFLRYLHDFFLILKSVKKVDTILKLCIDLSSASIRRNPVTVKGARSQKSLGFSEIVLKNKSANIYKYTHR